MAKDIFFPQFFSKVRLDKEVQFSDKMSMNKKIVWVALVGAACAAALPEKTWADLSIVKLETNYGDIVLELYPDDAPVSVANFLSYANRGFYDGLIFHRVIEEFMIQAGAFDPDLYSFLENDPNTADPEWWKNPEFYHEPNEPIINESDNGLLNERGTIAMARQTGLNSANSQFFINHADNPHLDPTSGNNGYAVFGRVIDGLDVVDAIAQLPTSEVDPAFEDLPDDPVIMLQVNELYSFDDTSDDFSQTPFLRASDGIERTFLGQVRFEGQQYNQQFSLDSHLEINGLRWQQTALENAQIDSFTLLLAKDTEQKLWILQYILNEGTEQEERLVDPNNPLDILLLEQFTPDNMLFRLINGNYNPENVADPNHTIIIGDGDDAVTRKIVSFSGRLTGLDAYGDNLVVVQTAKPKQDPFGWSYYHQSVGLVLSLSETSDDPADPNFYDPNDAGFTYRERTGWRLSWYGQSEPTFHPDSSDLGAVPFFHLVPGDIRIYRGQGLYDDHEYRLTASWENLLGVNCLTLTETAVPQGAKPDRTLWLATDTTGLVWVFKDRSGGLTHFQAVKVDQIIPATVYPDIHLRLASGQLETGTSVSSGQPPDQEITEIVSQDQSLERWPQFNEELVLVKTTADPNSDVLAWSYYHDSVGLILDLRPEGFPPDAEPNQIDPNDNGWIRTVPSNLEKIILKFTADENRQSPSDSFQAAGRFAAAPDDFAAGSLYVRVGPWHAAIDTEQVQQLRSRNKTYLVYDGSPDGIATIILLFDPTKGKFSFSGQKVNLTGLIDPVPVDIAVGSYFASAVGAMKGNRKPPMRFLQEYTDALRLKRFRFVFDNGPDSYTSYGLTLHGDIATRLTPLDLTQTDLTIKFGTKTYNLDAGDLVKRKNKNKYVYHHNSKNPRRVEFDLDKFTFKLVIKRDHLSKLPQQFRIQFEAAENEGFDEWLLVQPDN